MQFVIPVKVLLQSNAFKTLEDTFEMTKFHAAIASSLQCSG